MQDNGNKKEIKHLIQFMGKFFGHVFHFEMIDTHLFLLSILYYRWTQDPVKRLVWHSFTYIYLRE